MSDSKCPGTPLPGPPTALDVRVILGRRSATHSQFAILVEAPRCARTGGTRLACQVRIMRRVECNSSDLM